MNKNQERAINEMIEKYEGHKIKSFEFIERDRGIPELVTSHMAIIKSCDSIIPDLKSLLTQDVTTEHDDIDGISERVFTIAIIRDLNEMVLSGHITSSKMVELMNEAIKWRDVQFGNKYLCDMISDLKADPEAPIT